MSLQISSAIRSSVNAHRDGRYVTLRLTSSMYHRFHAPHDCRVEQVTYISGDTWNVNPIALKRIEKLFCKNERAVLRTRLTATGQPVTLVPVAAVLVASIRLHFLDTLLRQGYPGPNVSDVRRGVPERRRDGLVSARLDHRGFRAGRIQPVRPCAGGSEHPHGSAADADCLRCWDHRFRVSRWRAPGMTENGLMQPGSDHRHRQHRARCVPDHPLGGAAAQSVEHTMMPGGGHADEIDVEFDGRIDDRVHDVARP